jgi:hypothetical protein
MSEYFNSDLGVRKCTITLHFLKLSKILHLGA